MAILSNTLGYPATAAEIEERLRRLGADDNNAILIAVVANGEIAGWIHGAIQELLESGRHCEIFGLVVAERHRRLGIGRRLVETLEGWSIAKGFGKLAVRSNVFRPASHPFYENLGFALVKTQRVYHKHLRSVLNN